MAAPAIAVTLVSSHDCHLCERARRVLGSLAVESELFVREVGWDSEEGQSMVAADGVPFPPALFIEGSLAGYGRLSERALRRRLTDLRP